MTKAASKLKIEELISRYPALSVCRDSLNDALDMLCESFRSGHKLMVCGNGGSAADAEHIVGELMKGFLLPRTIDEELYRRMREICPDEADYFRENLQGALPAVALVDQAALNTAFANDQAADLSFAQQVLGLGRAGDVLLAITTSGNSRNVLYAMQTAKVKGIGTIALTGRSGGRARTLADVSVCVPEDETYRIQEYHLPIYHMLCMALEQEFFGEE